MSMPTPRQAWAYGLPALVISFAAIPIYLLTPQLYSQQLGLGLSAVGLVLMASRLIDAITDPMIGRWLDRTSGDRYARWMVPALILMLLAFAALLLPPAEHLGATGLLIWMGVAATAVSIANSAAGLTHQAWAVGWTASLEGQARLVSRRELLTLAGTIVASGLLGLSSPWPLLGVLVLGLGIALLGIARLRREGFARSLATPQHAREPQGSGAESIRAAETIPAQRLFTRPVVGLLTALTLNALANAIPPTLFLFFVTDQLGLPKAWAGGFLAIYFLTAAASMSYWTRLSARIGPQKTWLRGIALAVAGFIFAWMLTPGDGLWFAVVCLVTGVALGAELICPALLLGQALEREGLRGQADGRLFGVWNLLAKLSLAASAGLSLPLLEWAGYAPGAAAFALATAYAAVPTALKFLAFFGVWWLVPRLTLPPANNLTGAQP